jgi:Family of unknown function (DUF6252)
VNYIGYLTVLTSEIMRIVIGLLLIILCFGSNSCQKDFVISGIDSTLITPPGSVSGNFTAKIDGVQFVANKATGATRALNVIAITGEANDGGLIVLRVADSGVHVYTLDISSSSNAGVYSKDNGIAYTTNGGNSAAQSGGTLSITSIDTAGKTLSGTFSIKLYRPIDSTQKNITEGVFNNISYGTLAIPPANSTDTFRVKVDGVQFPVFSIVGISAFNMIGLSGSDQLVSKTVGVTIPSNVTPGSYTFTLFGPDYIGQYNVDSSYLAAESGTLIILEHNTTTRRIRGNFSFHASEIIGTKVSELTEGYFSVVYQ